MEFDPFWVKGMDKVHYTEKCSKMAPKPGACYYAAAAISGHQKIRHKGGFLFNPWGEERRKKSRWSKQFKTIRGWVITRMVKDVGMDEGEKNAGIVF